MPSDWPILVGAVVVVWIAGFVGIWNNWMWIGSDGWTIPMRYIPGPFRFWFSYIPRKVLGLSTGLEDVLRNTPKYRVET